MLGNNTNASTTTRMALEQREAEIMADEEVLLLNMERGTVPRGKILIQKLGQ